MTVVYLVYMLSGHYQNKKVMGSNPISYNIGSVYSFSVTPFNLSYAKESQKVAFNKFLCILNYLNNAEPTNEGALAYLKSCEIS